MDAVTRPTRLALAAAVVTLLLAACKSSEAPSVATTIVITPGIDTLRAVGRTQRFTAVVKDQRSSPMTTAKVTWATTNVAVVTVGDTSGVATAVGGGTARVTATSGAAADSVAVTVAQVAATVAKVSGDAQTGTVGQALASALVVQVNDSTGHAIAGTAVTFAVTAGGGGLGTATPTTGASGQAQTSWTLGGPAGSQSVSASVAGVTGVSFSATGTPGAAASVAKQAGDGQTTTTGATLPTAPSVIVKDAFGNPKAGVLVTFAATAGNGTVTGATPSTNASGIAAVGSWSLGNVGVDTLTATVTGTGITGNPVQFTATSQSAGAPATVVVFVGNNQPGLEGYGVNVRPAVRVTNAGGNPVPSTTVTFAVQTGGGSVTGGTATTNANGIAQVGKWTLGTSAGVSTLSATVTGGSITGNPVTFSDTAEAEGYPITVQFFGPTPSAAVQAAMDSAAAKWQRLIYGALSNVSLVQAAGTACGDTSAPAINVATTGLVIIAKFDSIDGPGKILGQAGPCLIRLSNSLSVLGEMEFDTADVASMISNGTLNSVMLHEMGHVIGFGTLWDGVERVPPAAVHATGHHQRHVLQLPEGPGRVRLARRHLIHRRQPQPARRQQDSGGELRGFLAAGCGAGTVNSHWREPVFGNELMTGYISVGANPLSAMTVAAKEDLGYKVNYDAADTYTQVFTAPVVGGAARTFLGDDIRRGPIYVVDDFGRGGGRAAAVTAGEPLPASGRARSSKLT